VTSKFFADLLYSGAEYLECDDDDDDDDNDAS
jgi:hypothetical protein